MNLIVLVIFSIAQRIVGEPTNALYNDLELATDNIKLTTFPSILIPKLTTNLGAALKSEEPRSVALMTEASNQENLPTISPMTNSTSDQTVERTSLNRAEQPIEPATSSIETSPAASEQNRTIEIASSPANGHTITTIEIRKANQTLLSTIMLRVHSVLQYSSNFSSRAVIPYVYMAKFQADGLYRQIADSTFLPNYVSNVFQTLVNDVMNQECNAFTTMINYVLVPAIDAHGSNYLTARTRELSDGVSRWHGALQRWSASLSSLFNQIAELKFEDCGQSLLCSLGKARYESVREEPRMNRAKIIQFVNNLFNMPMLEKRLKPNYALARQFGASGGDCGTLSSNCIINFDTLINLVKELF